MKKGFTLIELLAVIVILAVILAITIPGISNTIESSTKSAFESNAKMLLQAVNYKLLDESSFDPTTVNATNIESLLNIPGDNFETVIVSTLKGKLYIILQGKNKWNGLLAYGIYTDIKITDASNYTLILNHLGYDESKGVNEPKLASGMLPIKWDGSKWIETTASDSEWYNYNTTDKKWANARTKDGSMWVWIPRYIYKVSSNWHVNTTGTIDIQFSKGIDDNWNSSVIGNMSTDTTSNSSNNTWTNHPSFTFGSTDLTGIWVAKFEATASEGVANGYTSDQSCPIAGDDVATKAVKIIPNARSWRCIQIGRAFTASRNMETNSAYGWGTSGSGIDTHMIKNTEWGAVAYLSKSQYGKNTEEIYINNNLNYITGCAGNTVSTGFYIGCQNTYESTGGVKASTTGNVYGIYDMSGGTLEFAAAYINNGNGDLLQGSSITGAAAQYKDVYAKGTTDDSISNYALAINHKGDAIYETSNSYSGTNSWFSDVSGMPSGNSPWFLRGGSPGSGSGAGVFNFGTYWGGSGSSYGFRPVLLVNTGL